jgi:hypothetical protein
VGFESVSEVGLPPTLAVQGDAVIQLVSPTFLYFLFFVAGRGIALCISLMSENQVLFLDIRAYVRRHAFDPLCRKIYLG